MITNKMLRFLLDQMKKDTDKYEKFHDDYSIFLKEGILSTNEQVQKVRNSKACFIGIYLKKYILYLFLIHVYIFFAGGYFKVASF